MAVRKLSLTLCTFALAALLVPAATFASGATQAQALDSSLLQGLNTIRLAHGLVPLQASPQLNAAAAAHSDEMVANGYFGHASSNGAPFWKRIGLYYSASSYGSWSVGENLLWSAGSVDSSAALAKWMSSPMHRANILFPGWRQVGIAALSSPDAPGRYGGLPVTVITTDFGART